MKLTEFLRIMECIAPRALAWERDNPGLLIGTRKTELHRVLIALDATPETVREAVEQKADLLLCHHPLFWDPVRRILPDDPYTAAAYDLIQNNIAMFAAHTNLDAAQGGVNDQLAKVLGLQNVQLLSEDALGRMGAIAPTTLGAFTAFVEEALHTRALICGDADRPVSRIAVVGGAGGSDVQEAAQSGADVFLTGEIKHDQALAARQLGLALIAAGHYQTESVVLYPLMHRLQEFKSDVQYNVTRFETACLRGI